MININHPKICGKPPVNKSFVTKELKQKEITDNSKEKEIDHDPIVMENTKKIDCNENIVESTMCSFEQICNIISDLEKDINAKIPEINQLQVRENYSEHFI